MKASSLQKYITKGGERMFFKPELIKVTPSGAGSTVMSQKSHRGSGSVN